MKAERGALPSCVTAIREDGDRPPLFLVHEFTGIDAYFARLSAQIDPAIPVYGLTGVPFDQAQLDTMESLAARLVDAIVAVCPQPPYCVAGYSFGGSVAYEIAAQLETRRQTVAFVGLLDSHYYPGLKGGFKKCDTPQEEFVELLYWQKLDDVKRASAGCIAQAAPEMDLTRLVAEARNHAVIPSYLAEYPDADLCRIGLRMAAHRRAARAYRPHAIAAPVYLFAAETKLEHAGSVPTDLLGWETVADLRVRRIVVPGNHVQMMSANIGALGAAMSSILLRERH